MSAAALPGTCPARIAVDRARPRRATNRGAEADLLVLADHPDRPAVQRTR